MAELRSLNLQSCPRLQDVKAVAKCSKVTDLVLDQCGMEIIDLAEARSVEASGTLTLTLARMYVTLTST